MERPETGMAQPIAQEATVIEQGRTGHQPHSVTVVLGDDALVDTLNGALSEAEKAMSREGAGTSPAAFHQSRGLAPK